MPIKLNRPFDKRCEISNGCRNVGEPTVNDFHE